MDPHDAARAARAAKKALSRARVEAKLNATLGPDAAASLLAAADEVADKAVAPVHSKASVEAGGGLAAKLGLFEPLTCGGLQSIAEAPYDVWYLGR